MSNINPKWGDWKIQPPPVSEEEIINVEETDVVVIGAGIAGMTCALRAAQCGCSVTVLEQSQHWSARAGNIGIIDSTYMKNRGWDYKAEDVAREWIKICGNRCDEKLVWLYLKNGGKAMDWLIDLVGLPDYHCTPVIQGCTYKGEKYRELETSHTFLGGAMAEKGNPMCAAEALNAEQCEGEKLGVKYLFNIRARQVTQDSDGKITGVIALSGEGYSLFRARKGVVLATGGIDGNFEMCEDLAPIANRCAKKIYWPKGANMGDGHRMGLWAGGVFEDTPFPAMIHPQAYSYIAYCFLHVKPDGTRFMNEDNFVQGKSNAILREGLKFAWAIFDSEWPTKVPPTLQYGGGMFWGQDCLKGQDAFDPELDRHDLERSMRLGEAFQADTPEELADKIDVPAEAFTATLRRYNELCAAGADEDFGKRRELMIPVDKPPYYATKIGPALLAVVGGLRVDLEMRVLNEERKPITGLYAIGNVMGGRYGVDYPIHVPGNSVGTAITYGWLLGAALGRLPEKL